MFQGDPGERGRPRAQIPLLRANKIESWPKLSYFGLRGAVCPGNKQRQLFRIISACFPGRNLAPGNAGRGAIGIGTDGRIKVRQGGFFLKCESVMERQRLCFNRI